MTMPQTLLTQGSPPPSGSSPNGTNPLEQKAATDERNARILAWVNEQYSLCRNQRKSIERQWYINLAFFFGRQNITMVTTAASLNGYKLYTPPSPPWRVRLVVNKIRPVVRRNLAKLTRQKPRFTVVPATTEDEDLVSARVGEAIFDSAYRDLGIKDCTRRVAWWGLICGTSFYKSYWDPAKKSKTGDQGDFDVQAVTPFHLFVPDLKEEDIENQPYVIHASLKSPEWVEQVFKTKAPTIKATDDILEDSFLNLIGAKQTSRDQVLVLEVWLKPGTTKLFPKGGMIIVAGDRVVQTVDGYPYEHGEYPFSKFTEISSGRFYGDSVIVDLLPIQKEYNRTRSQIIENKNRMAKLQLIAPRGSINASQITSEPGQIILYTPGFNPPAPLPLQPIPAYVLEEVSQLQQDIDDLSGQHEISRGQNPAQVTAATALSYLQEQDDTMLAEAIDSLESCIEKVGRCLLSYVTQFWNTERLVRVVGRDGSFDAQVYKGADLRGNHDLKVEAGSALPTSKAAKQAFLMDLMKMGLINPQQGLELLDLGGIEKAYESFLVDTRQAQRENLKLSEGMEVPVNDWDNHPAHIEYHNRFRKQQQFEILDDRAKQIFQAHVAMHQALIGQAEPPGLDIPGGPSDPSATMLGGPGGPSGPGGPGLGGPGGPGGPFG